MHELRKLIGSVTSQLYASALLQCVLLAASAYLFVSAFTGSAHTISVLSGVAGFAAGIGLTRVFQNKKRTAISLIHQFVDGTEHSLHLLDKAELNLAEQLQMERIAGRQFDFPFLQLYRGSGAYAGLLVFAAAFHFIYPTLNFDKKEKKVSVNEHIKTQKKNSLVAPEFNSASVIIIPPAYTKLPKRESGDLNVSTISGSSLQWKIAFTHAENLEVRLANNRGEEIAFRRKQGSFIHSDRLTGSGLYAIKGYWKDSLVYQSEFYRLEAIPDLAPKIEPASKELYKYHFLKDKKTIRISAKISDDFLVKQAFIVATLARGSGENVKFREVKFPLAPSDFKQARLQKEIDLNALNFAPGDELYYYWAAVDNKTPQANFSKSDTYFLVFKDTAQIEEAELATMAVNIMPEYFRSQRQIIIDTEKLITRRKKLAKKEFASVSNEIGFDQKVLRLRYGQYLGEEFETSIGGGGAPPPGTDGGNMLDAFTHKSDGEGEAAERRASEPAHQDTHEHGNEHSDAAEKDPIAALMEQYVHAHDDAETNTFYEESTRSLLKMALEQMWQSELHLRMYEPEKALPFEHKALEYLKSAQHKARTYVKKSGYDPPPIKEKEKRLSGELKEISSDLNSVKFFDDKSTAQLAAEISGYLEMNIRSEKQQLRLQQIGAALSNRLISSGPFNGGLKHWEIIGVLQKLVSGKPLARKEMQHLKSDLARYTDRSEQSKRGYSSEKKLEQAFWKKMQ
ncbi:hypothetical protein [Dyadobacter sediminis]|uniref:DUF4175 domain-containing protein n=1 Tax=Dyadobacter sediminis TaxID=1493691 RepID=A0A5R9KBH1_9BACT|nr:hypothetical protein [Dyadobacter sediminis]TLU92079.1 hypothetical protein FEM55_15120 [Dyadobacter sediminis]GGB97611.1 hypothetical protein GCM10011325_26180 [Dyadobacter sediminis]